MEIRLRVVPSGAGELPAGAPVRVELRDTALADAPSVLVAWVDTRSRLCGAELSPSRHVKYSGPSIRRR